MRSSLRFMPTLRVEALSVGYFFEISSARNLRFSRPALNSVSYSFTSQSSVFFVGLGGRQQWWMTISSRKDALADVIVKASFGNTLLGALFSARVP